MLRGIGRLRAGGAGGWTPASLGSSLLVWHDPSDLTTQWQDSARTTAAAVDQTVGSAQNKGSASFYSQQATAGSRPFLKQDGSGYWYWDFDSLDDNLATSATVDLSGYTSITVCIGVRKIGQANIAAVMEFGSNAYTSAGFNIFAPRDAGNSNYGFALYQTAAAAYAATTFAAPISNVLSCVFDYGGATIADEIKPRVNGAIPTLSAAASGPAGTGSFGNQTLYIGRRAGSTLPFDGRIYQVVIAGGTLSASDLSRLERYVGSKMGITL